MINIRLAKKTDLNSLAVIYKNLYDNAVLKEDWSVEKSYKLLHFFYTLQPDIFVVAEEKTSVIGAVVSLVKPWFDGNRLIETEIFVSKNWQHQGIASRLFMEHFKRAMDLYDVQTIEAHSYQEENGFPLNWYKKQGYAITEDLCIINGNIQKIYGYLKKKWVKKNAEV